jgi:hypothetical protein
MTLTPGRAKELISNLLSEIALPTGEARTDSFVNLRAVDAKVREFKMTLREAGATRLADDMEGDSDFEANSRRVRLEALGHYCRTALRFFDSGALVRKKILVKGPDLTGLTRDMPDLENVIQDRWLEAQKCQHAQAYCAAVIMMGSVLEALLLARAYRTPTAAYQASAAPKDRSGKSPALHDWTLNSLIDVSVECNWIKSDRGKFSHALRDSRNIVHPYEHARSRAAFDENTCKVCWQVLNASVDDLLESI